MKRKTIIMLLVASAFLLATFSLAGCLGGPGFGDEEYCCGCDEDEDGDYGWSQQNTYEMYLTVKNTLGGPYELVMPFYTENNATEDLFSTTPIATFDTGEGMVRLVNETNATGVNSPRGVSITSSDNVEIDYSHMEIYSESLAFPSMVSSTEEFNGYYSEWIGMENNGTGEFDVLIYASAPLSIEYSIWVSSGYDNFEINTGGFVELQEGWNNCTLIAQQVDICY